MDIGARLGGSVFMGETVGLSGHSSSVSSIPAKSHLSISRFTFRVGFMKFGVASVRGCGDDESCLDLIRRHCCFRFFVWAFSSFSFALAFGWFSCGVAFRCGVAVVGSDVSIWGGIVRSTIMEESLDDPVAGLS